MCETSEGENCGNCPSDCGACQFVCGNGVCFNSENCAICRQHCGHFAPKDMLASLNSANSSIGSVLLSIRQPVFPLQFVVDDYLSEETTTFEILNSVLASLDSRPTRETEIQKIKKAHLKKQKQLLKESEKQKKKKRKNISKNKKNKRNKRRRKTQRTNV